MCFYLYSYFFYVVDIGVSFKANFTIFLLFYTDFYTPEMSTNLGNKLINIQGIGGSELATIS